MIIQYVGNLRNFKRYMVLGANLLSLMFGQIKHMLADPSDGSRSVCEQELPVGFIVQ